MDQFIEGRGVLSEIEKGDIYTVLVASFYSLLLTPGKDAPRKLSDCSQLGWLANSFKRGFLRIDKTRPAVFSRFWAVGYADRVSPKRAIHYHLMAIGHAGIGENRSRCHVS